MVYLRSATVTFVWENLTDQWLSCRAAAWHHNRSGQVSWCTAGALQTLLLQLISQCLSEYALQHLTYHNMNCFEGFGYCFDNPRHWRPSSSGVYQLGIVLTRLRLYIKLTTSAFSCIPVHAAEIIHWAGAGALPCGPSNQHRQEDGHELQSKSHGD